MKKIIMAIALCLICAVSVMAQTESNTRIPTTYFINENGNLDFKDCIFTFDSTTNLIAVTMLKDSVYVGEFQGVIHFYTEEGEDIKQCKVVVVSSAETNTYSSSQCGCVIPYILTHKGGFIKFEICLGPWKSLMNIVLCDNK